MPEESLDSFVGLIRASMKMQFALALQSMQDAGFSKQQTREIFDHLIEVIYKEAECQKKLNP